MKKWMIAGIAVCVLACLSCAPALYAQPAPSPTEAEPIPTVTPFSTYTPIATAAPDPTPTPVPTPVISDQWYARRTEELETWMRKYGDYADEEAIKQQLFTWEIDPRKPMVALTFDDGPKYGVTDGILDVLKQYNVRATFFVLGWRLPRGDTALLLQRILGQGCEIGNHTWNHDNLRELDAGGVRAAIKRTNDAIFQYTGYTPRSIRPPGGASSKTVRTQAGKLDMAVVLWSQSGNVHLFRPEEICANVLCQAVNGRQLQSGDIILLHDTKEFMVEAVKLLIPELLDRGYQLVTVQEILYLSQEGFVAGNSYRSQFQ